ncbi:MAG: hypothetical protein HY701_02740 [Gemmatimonadetes bacterium]|nr:hypothetical protein [Gemmatimonadota bacterium]
MPVRTLIFMAPLTWAAVLAPQAAGPQAASEFRVTGVVLRGTEPLPGTRVVLHRAGGDAAGPIDSLQADQNGRFSFRATSPVDPFNEIVYFTSVRYQGIMYFGEALAGATASDSVHIIQVYDTVTAPPTGAAVDLGVRHLILEQSEGGWLATDLIQLSHTGDRTYVAPPNGSTWTYQLPLEASDLQVGESDLPPDAATLSEGILRVSAPISPGERMYLVRYRLPALAVDVPIPGETARFELLLREPTPPVSIAGLEPQQPVELQGNTYRRWVGLDLQNATVRVRETEVPAPLPMAWMAAALSLILAAATLFAWMRQPATAITSPRDEVVLEIARLDEEFEQQVDADAETRKRYELRRSHLKRLLLYGADANRAGTGGAR